MAPRLSATESGQLMRQHAELSTALAQSQAELEQARGSLAEQQARNEAVSAELAQARTALQPLQEDLALLQNVLPADPRGGALQIRAGRFVNEDDGLGYH